jgi:hypothetical protein
MKIIMLAQAGKDTLRKRHLSVMEYCQGAGVDSVTLQFWRAKEKTHTGNFRMG